MTRQVNATGVMPVIFSSSLLAAPAALSRYFPQVRNLSVILPRSCFSLTCAVYRCGLSIKMIWTRASLQVPAVEGLARTITPGGVLYLPVPS